MRGAVRRRYVILTALGVIALAIVLLPGGVARLLGLDGQLGWIFLAGALALLVSGVRFVVALFRRQRLLDMHMRRRGRADPVEEMKTITALDADLHRGRYH